MDLLPPLKPENPRQKNGYWAKSFVTFNEMNYFHEVQENTLFCFKFYFNFEGSLLNKPNEKQSLYINN